MKPKRRSILPDVNAMLQQLPVNQRLEAAVSLIGFGVSEFGKLVLQALEQRQPRRAPLVTSTHPSRRVSRETKSRRRPRRKR
jgi:hypothetical protein